LICLKIFIALFYNEHPKAQSAKNWPKIKT
jgi:hypothetical protein